MTARPYIIHGVELVGADGECCSACDRPALGRSISGHLICATHAGWAAHQADEMAREKEASAKRRAAKMEQHRARVAHLMAIGETVKGDNRRRANGHRAAAETRRNNRSGEPSPRAEQYRQYYAANRERKIAQVLEHQRKAKAPKPKHIRAYRSTDE